MSIILILERFTRSYVSSLICGSLEDNRKVYWVSFLDGLQRVLLFTQCEDIVTRSESSTALQSITQSVEVKIHGIGLSVINNETGVDILYLGITSSGVCVFYEELYSNIV